ncbi:MAG: hypothetical protein KKB42_00190 [Gammaproteobacteria bacterium]|nr:hypothetical protein [Gammaproteobacteria bacterium]
MRQWLILRYCLLTKRAKPQARFSLPVQPLSCLTVLVMRIASRVRRQAAVEAAAVEAAAEAAAAEAAAAEAAAAEAAAEAAAVEAAAVEAAAVEAVVAVVAAAGAAEVSQFF